MKIQEHHQPSNKAQVLLDLKDLLRQPSDRQARPCPDCKIRFGKASILSAENCSMKCKYAPRHMSSNPDQFPVEGGIVPLVYALYTMRLITPCWSCEGHLLPDGSIWKLPKVWFYADSDFYPKLVSQVISDMQINDKISRGWRVSIMPFSQSMYSTTYSIEPTDINVSLKDLQNDIIEIGKNLRHDLLVLAKDYVKRGMKRSNIRAR